MRLPMGFDYVTALEIVLAPFLILGPFALPIYLCFRKPKAALAFVCAYAAAYVTLSFCGHYIERVEATADGTRTWYPLLCENRTPGSSGRIKTGPSNLGVLFWPLLVIDQTLIHPEVCP